MAQVMMKGTATREAVMRAGLRMLSVQGLAGVTIGQLASASNLSKSGLFAHFSSKPSLQIALLDEMVRVAQLHVVAPAQTAPEGLPRLQGLVALWMGWPARAGLPGGCPVAAALFELDDLDGDVRDHAVALEREWRDLLLHLVEQAVKMGHLAMSTDQHQFVWELNGIYLSHHASSRFLRDPGASDRARTAVDALIERYSTGPVISSYERTGPPHA